MISSTAKRYLREAIEQLSLAGIRDAARDARILLADAMGEEPGLLITAQGRDPSKQELSRFTSSVSSRCQRQPVAQIIGHRDFWQHTFRVTPDVLDPRPETEVLVERALQTATPKRILDLGTGTGCLAISLLLDLPDATALATDISQNALSVASSNAVDAGVADRLKLQKADWFAGVEGKYDLIVCNPPYISSQEFSELGDDVRLWEPKIALTSGTDGLDAYRILSAGLSKQLDVNGIALFEIGHRQEAAVTAIFYQAGFHKTRVHKDLGGSDRVVEVMQSGTTNG